MACDLLLKILQTLWNKPFIKVWNEQNKQMKQTYYQAVSFVYKWKKCLETHLDLAFDGNNCGLSSKLLKV